MFINQGFITARLFSMLFCVMMLFLIVSCGKDEEDSISPTTPPETTNLSPEISAQSFEVPESITDTDVIGVVVASDPEKGALEFSITEDLDNLFEITKEGELSLNTISRLDFEAIDQHEITVTVSDGDLEASATVVINVIDVDETASYFITTWETFEPNQEITIPVFDDEKSEFTYNYSVDWGDGTVSYNQNADASHTYANAGTYTVKIDGIFPAIYFNNEAFNSLRLKTIEQWGSIQWKSMHKAFYGCDMLVLNAEDEPDLSQVVDMSGMFWGAHKMNQDISNWDVSSVTNMSNLFRAANTFNQDISNWDVSNVTNMSAMFHLATSFNQDINLWNVSNVIDMSLMFSDASEFNQQLQNWDVSSVTDMSYMFESAWVFNQDLSGWDVSKVTNMEYMFEGAYDFSQAIGAWDVGSVTNMNAMFFNAYSFDQNISPWDVSIVTDMRRMFDHATSFNQDISNWNVSSVKDMSYMFNGASVFNQDISSWDVSSVNFMGWMFSGASLFNQSLGDLNLGSSVGSMSGMLNRSGMSTDNYDDTLVKWSELSDLRSNMVFGAEGLSYCNDGEEARNILISKGWDISGDSKSADCP